MDDSLFALLGLAVAAAIFVVGLAIADIMGGDDDDDHFAW